MTEPTTEVLGWDLPGHIPWHLDSQRQESLGGSISEYLACYPKKFELYPVGNREPFKGFKPESDLHIGKVTLTGYRGQRWRKQT